MNPSFQTRQFIISIRDLLNHCVIPALHGYVDPQVLQCANLQPIVTSLLDFYFYGIPYREGNLLASTLPITRVPTDLLHQIEVRLVMGLDSLVRQQAGVMIPSFSYTYSIESNDMIVVTVAPQPPSEFHLWYAERFDRPPHGPG